MAHQQAAIAKVLPSRVGALFMEMGTGKSLTCAELARLRQDKWDRLFWFCPVSLKETVLQQLLEHTTLDASEIAVWGQKVSTENLPESQRIHIIGIESMSSSDRIYLAYLAMVTDRSFVAVDESGYIKGHNSRRTTRITDASEKARYRLVMTGTPFTQGVVDLYAQMRFLSPRILGFRSFHSFAANHLEYAKVKDANGFRRKTSQIVRAHDIDLLAAKIAPYTYQVRKDECLELPEKLHETRWCEMTSEQSALYSWAKHEILSKYDCDDWSPVKIFHLFTALQTIVCGFYTDSLGRVDTVPHNRIGLLLSTISEIPEDEPVVIWAKYRHSVEDVAQTLAASFGDEAVHCFYGDMSERERNESIARWKNQGRFFVATQACGSHGLNDLVGACYVIFYADGFKYSERLQAEDRNHRIGQNRRPVYISLRCAGTIDTRIASAIERKGDALASFVAEVETARERGMKKRAIELVKKL